MQLASLASLVHVEIWSAALDAHGRVRETCLGGGSAPGGRCAEWVRCLPSNGGHGAPVDQVLAPMEA